ncbi:TPA: spore coat protein U domain-containing protein [Stenotrophomonas maltophilia]|uniref:Csu type fimbrial protein n=1 Tax=Stenotrophomonas maltophilia TaxID=40324 RepID=UPI00066E218F|nr:spore coat U domain-containing protein [Stenotrophomonas maltophilia]EKU9963918.1 spore coat protein U domain-containing protein [Stenotrophomonas maltophilia]MBA0335143.1 SCPU domain-containing protein [Stenotrophomonas maltophilia]MBA0539486.1 SCPU domain-containing protein [Stenotrophomonas maltophilia]MBH1740915.1 spore coat protein U domain-containing protein [Stenotrophomonas maltophilia]MBY8924588.1 spore coat U domain-containing protein [Stenotrophomonas maltophilia]
MRTLLLGLLLVAGLLAAAPARAVAVCAAVADPTLPFGNVNSNAPGATTGTLNITVTCTTAALSLLATTGVRVCVGVGAGSGGGSSSSWRTMKTSASDSMNFQLYNTSNFSQVTGLTPRGTPPAQELTMTYSVPLLTGGSGAQSTQLFAQIPANQILASGAYSSTFSGANVVLTWAWNEVLLGTATVPATCNGGATGTNSASAAFSFTATANVLPQCGSYVTTNMNFGNVTGGIPANIDRTATLTLTCLKNTAYQVSLNNGQNNPTATSTRRMATTIGGSTYYLTYELYRDAARSLRWGNTLNVDTVGGTGSGSAQQLTIHGRVPPVTGQPPAGIYNDVVQVTITY